MKKTCSVARNLSAIDYTTAPIPWRHNLLPSNDDSPCPMEPYSRRGEDGDGPI